MILSIIIPAKNEEIFLPKLLKSIKKQNFHDYEIIVADADSTDRTIEIAKNYGAKVVKGGMPARGRNAGAKAAKGEILLFLDADVLLPENFFKKAILEFRREKLDIASMPIYPITKDAKIKIFFDIACNFPLKKLERVSPHGPGCAIIIKKSIHYKLNGYNEELKLSEDHDFVKRAAKIGKFRVLRGVGVYISLRRFYQDGWTKIILLYILCEMHLAFIGPIKSDILNYKLDHYSKKIKD